MKIISVLAVLLFMASCAVNKHKGINDNTKSSKNYKPFKKFGGDTTKYLNYNFITNKQAYIGKKVSTLLNDLELQVKDCSYMGMHYDFTTTNMILLSFYEKNEGTDRQLSGSGQIDFIHVYLENFVSTIALDKLNKETNSSWSEKHAAYLGNIGIKDIQITSYP